VPSETQGKDEKDHFSETDINSAGGARADVASSTHAKSNGLSKSKKGAGAKMPMITSATGKAEAGKHNAGTLSSLEAAETPVLVGVIASRSIAASDIGVVRCAFSTGVATRGCRWFPRLLA
jgi:hypothetical protein